MLTFKKRGTLLLLTYEPEQDSEDWVEGKLLSGAVTFARTFHFEPNDIFSNGATNINSDDEDIYEGDQLERTFVLGRQKGSYFKIPGRIFHTDHDVYLAQSLPIDRKTFVAYRNISVFRHIDDLVDEDIYIGGTRSSAIPPTEFARLLKTFPNTTELNHYAGARITKILKDYLGTTTDAEKKFEDFLSRRASYPKAATTLPMVLDYERHKYEFIRDAITEALREETAISENEWRDLMLQFILLIFPKYICVLKNVLLKDFYTANRPKNRYLDLALVDANGHLDVIEIKKPHAHFLISESAYRGNFTPKKDLSGAVMQAEKYLFNLSKWGVEGERDINKRQSAYLPDGLSVKITNPKAIVIAGRSNNLTAQQLLDFELIKRKYANIVDILSYDDLLFRLAKLIEKFAPAH